MKTWTTSKPHFQITHYHLSGFDRWHVVKVTNQVYIRSEALDQFIPMKSLKAAKARIEEKAAA